MAIHKLTSTWVVLFWGIFIWVGTSIDGGAATLIHRYSFGTDANDSVGGANGTLQGNALITNGTVALDGSNSWVRLPNELVTNYNSISVEFWFSNQNINPTNAILFVFRGLNNGMIYKLNGQGSYFSGATSQSINLANPPVAGTNHLIWAQNDATKTATIFLNGMTVAQNTNFTLKPNGLGSLTNLSIGGAGRLTTVSNFSGAIHEFRIYNGAINELEAAVLDANGPDNATTTPGTLQNITVENPGQITPGALFRPVVRADFNGATNVNISTQPDLVLISDNPNVITVSPNNRIQTHTLGSANLTAIWQGFSNTLALSVSPPQDIALLHRYGFNEQTNDWIVHDSVGGKHGHLRNISGSPNPKAAFTGNGELILSGGTGGNLPSPGGYVALPSGIISELSEISIEAWFTWTYSPSSYWQRIFDFGSLSSIPPSTVGTNYLFLTTYGSFVGGTGPHFAITTNMNVFENPRLDCLTPLSVNSTSFVAVTYSPFRRVTKLYVNGVLVRTGVATIPLANIFDTNNWLGRSQFSNDPYFGGRYNEFRIYRGLLSNEDIAADYIAGPETVGVDHVLHSFTSSNGLAISWGPSVSNEVLKTAADISNPSWIPVPNIPVLENGRIRVNLPMTENAAFYRLLAP